VDAGAPRNNPWHGAQPPLVVVCGAGSTWEQSLEGNMLLGGSQ